MVEASLIILHRNPFYLLWGFFFILLQILDKTAIAIRPTYRSDYSAPTICIHVSPSPPPAYLAVSSSEKIAKHSLIIRKQVSLFVILMTLHVSENSSLYLYTEIFNFSSFIWISIFNESSKKKKYIPLIVYSFASI